MKELMFVMVDFGLDAKNPQENEVSEKSESAGEVKSDNSEGEIQDLLSKLHERIQKRKSLGKKLPPNRELVALLEKLEGALEFKQENPGPQANKTILLILNQIDDKLTQEEKEFAAAPQAEASSPQEKSYLEFGSEEPEVEEETIQASPVKETVVAQTKSSSVDELYEKSIDFLKKTQLDSGGCLATTQDERYPYIYPRDHAFTTLAFVESKNFDEARKALEFSLKSQSRETGAFPQRWDQNGNDASYKAVSVDAVALVLYSFARYVQESSDADFAEKNWDKALKAIDFLKSKLAPEKNLLVTSNSLNEFPPLDMGYEFWANACAAAAVEELSKIASTLKVRKDPSDLNNAIKEGMLNFLWNSRLDSFVKNIRIKESSSVIVSPDASIASVSFFELFPSDSKRVKNTIERIETELVDSNFGGVARHPPIHGADIGGHGPWPFHTLLLAKHFVHIGEKDKALHYINWVAENSSNGQICEHLTTKEEFEKFVSDYRDAGLLKKDLMVMVENTRKHEKFQQGIARITEPFAMSHSMFVIVYGSFKKKFE